MIEINMDRSHACLIPTRKYSSSYVHVIFIHFTYVKHQYCIWDTDRTVLQSQFYDASLYGGGDGLLIKVSYDDTDT